MQEPKILFFLAVWRRPEITELCFMGLNRLMKYNSNASSLAVISEKSMIPLCEKYGIEYVEHENEPLGRKKNFGLTGAMRKEWDYLIELGSDDLILNTIFEIYLPLMEKGEDFFGSDTMYFIDATDGNIRHYQAKEAQWGRGWGLGRAMSRKMLETFSGRVMAIGLTGGYAGEVISEGSISFIKKQSAESLEKQGVIEILDHNESYYLWTDSAMRCLDNDSSQRIESMGYKYKPVSSETFLADIKSDENLWGFNPELGEKGDLEKFVNQLSQDERSLFFANMKKLKAKRIEYAS